MGLRTLLAAGRWALLFGLVAALAACVVGDDPPQGAETTAAAPGSTEEPTTSSGTGGESTSSSSSTSGAATTSAPSSTSPSSSSTTADPSTSVTAPPNTSSSVTTTTTLPPLEPPTYEALERIRVIRNFTGYTSRGLRRWQREVEAVEDVRITSTADGAEQPALWLPPRGDRPRPLLVVLHSWSAHYLQHAGIPYAMWAEDNGWAVIAPNYRGVNDDADSTGSDLAVQDAVDAIDWATAQDGVDADHVYTVGYSGGGMMSLLLAGRHPEKVAAAAAWGPPYDLVDFYRQARRQGRHYAWDLERACGGNPTSDADALASCVHRSPMAHLDAAREFSVPVFIGQGIWDTIVSPSQGARAFNQLADPEDRFSDEQVETFGRQRVPESISQPVAAESHFTDGDPGVVLARRSASVSLVYFRANHEMVYGASLRFFVDHLRNGQPPDPS